MGDVAVVKPDLLVNCACQALLLVDIKGDLFVRDKLVAPGNARLSIVSAYACFA